MKFDQNKKLEVLLVEDNQDHAHFIRRSLGDEHYAVTWIADGKEAFDYIINPSGSFDVVLLDYYLPSMDGLEILKKTLKLGKDIAFIFLTVDNRISTAVEVMKAGAMDFLPKTAQFYDDLPYMIEKVYALHKSRQEKKRLEEQIRISLKEKELLLKEIHHRVKNNLSIIYSLLQFQEQYASRQSIGTILENTRHRIRSMALVHEKLDKAHDLTHIYFPEYCQDLVGHLMETLRPHPPPGAEEVAAVIEVDDIHLDIDTIIPLGLIINELVTNAITHGFPVQFANLPEAAGNKPAQIKLSMQCDKGGSCSLTVANNGKALSRDFDWTNSETLGMFIIRSLVEQLNGSMEVRQNEQTEFILGFQIGPASPLEGEKA
jgi:two-component sensor histidine kinase/CheY-like chemotaxis protein